MAKIISVTFQPEGSVASLMLEDGTLVALSVGDNLFTQVEHDAEIAEMGKKIEQTVAELQAEIGSLRQQLVAKPVGPAPQLHNEFQDVPLPRTLDKLPSLDMLLPHPALDIDEIVGQEPEPPTEQPAETSA